MRRLMVMLLVSASPAGAQSALGPPEPTVAGETRVLRSSSGEDVRLHIRRPGTYDSRRERYPVVYVLDPDWNLEHAASTVRFLAANARMPEAIVVGVEVADRNRDFTPTHDTGPGGFDESGGGPAFLKRLAEEVIPTIDAAYRTQPLRVLVGHSLGGLFAVWAFSERPSLFQGAVALDPSLWWSRGAVARTISSRLGDTTGGFRRLVLVEGTPSAETAQITDAPPPGVQISRVPVVGESHLSMTLIGLYSGLSRLFADYVPGLRHDADLARPDAVLAQYRELSARYGYAVSPPEATLREIADRALNQRDRADATRAAELLRRFYPDSPSAQRAATQTMARAAELDELPMPPASILASEPSVSPFLGTWQGVADHEPGHDVRVTVTLEPGPDRVTAKGIAHGIAFDGSDLRYSYRAAVVHGDTLELWAQNSGGGYMVSILTRQPDGSLRGTVVPRHVPLPPGAVLPDVRVILHLRREGT